MPLDSSPGASPEHGDDVAHPSTAADKKRARSGDFSRDPAFDPEAVFRVMGREENSVRVADAMRSFLASGEISRFDEAIAAFVRSARARHEPIEHVLAALIALAGEHEGVAYPHDLTPTELRRLVMRGVLLAFYGESTAEEGG